MCGVAGFLDFRRTLSAEAQREVCGRMADALAHRGPDDRGVWSDATSGIALGHRRLSILDLSPLGHQPMASTSGRFVVAYNGEIYNFGELRGELAGHLFRGRSDTEVLLAAFEEWGVEGALPRFNGMFALAVWDTHERALWLARDRFGEKPLYYGRMGHALVFGSELKAVRCFPGFNGEVDRGALAQFMRFGCVPSPACIFQGMRKLPAATFLRLKNDRDIEATPVAYWSLEAVAREGVANRYRGSDGEAVAELGSRLRDAVKLRMVADVPLGAFLSGGVDSSTVVAMMQAGESRKVKTFTIGFEEAEWNEADSARAVATHLGTEHTELYVSAAQAQTIIPRLPSLYDEPFADSSQIPTFLVAQLAREHVTVALSGDAGDELFGGYARYSWAESVWKYLRKLPHMARDTLAASIRAARPARFDPYVAALDPVLPPRLRVPGDKLERFADLLAVASQDDLYLWVMSTWREPGRVVHATEPRHPILQERPPRLDAFLDRMMCSDALTYLPDDILVKVDRAAMGVGLETRVPLLDPAIARFAWSLPSDMKVRGGKGKWILREVLATYLPRKLFERPKMGFGVPIDSWLRGPLRAWAESELSEARLRREGFFDAGSIRQKWREHLSGRRNWQHHLWPVLMFQSWREHWGVERDGHAERRA
jgi:asparagine synthase (glutamine-hydrolysing)